tara:strand:- start:1 stop:774 length:774 start_codon:yes stop_codon:yes gene_type:complete
MDLTRLIISNERLKLSKNKILKLSFKESHYLNNVMRTQYGDLIFITNGLGLLWKAKNLKNNSIQILDFNKPFLHQNKSPFLIGLATAIPKNGFENILKMSTEIGIDIIQPLTTDRQIKKITNLSNKNSRWNNLINESVEQCETLWKPKLLECESISNWIQNICDKDLISVSATRNKNSIKLKNWLNNIDIKLDNKNKIIWNVIGPEGGWSKSELSLFMKYKIQVVKLSETILRTSTAAISAVVFLNEWKNQNINLIN